MGRIDLFLAKGEIRFYLKNGNGMTFQRLPCSLPLYSLIIYLCSTYYLQVTGRVLRKESERELWLTLFAFLTEVWVHLHLEVTFDGTFDQDVKLLTL